MAGSWLDTDSVCIALQMKCFYLPGFPSFHALQISLDCLFLLEMSATAYVLPSSALLLLQIYAIRRYHDRRLSAALKSNLMLYELQRALWHDVIKQG